MSFYNIIHGQNPFALIFLQMLGFKSRDDVGRFRDAFLSEDGAKIYIYTRNGGGNRDYYMPNFSEHPNYLKDYDDDFDCTYATIEFSVPNEWEELAKSLATGEEVEAIGQKFKNSLDNLKNMSKEDIKNKYPAIIAVMDKITKFVSDSEVTNE